MSKTCVNYDVEPPVERECGDYTWVECDARGIPLGGRVCEHCWDEKMARYKKQFKEEIFDDPNYETVEPIDPEGWTSSDQAEWDRRFRDG